MKKEAIGKDILKMDIIDADGMNASIIKMDDIFRM